MQIGRGETKMVLYSQGLSSRAGKVLLLRRAMLEEEEEEVTGRAGLKLGAPGEQDRQAEGTATGTLQ